MYYIYMYVMLCYAMLFYAMLCYVMHVDQSYINPYYSLYIYTHLRRTFTTIYVSYCSIIYLAYYLEVSM